MARDADVPFHLIRSRRGGLTRTRELDARGEVVSGGNGEMEAGAVFDAGRNA